MDLEHLEKRLLAAARADKPGDRVPYTFEKRVMAHLRGTPEPDVTGVWARNLWRACAPCLAVMLLLAAWTGFSSEPVPAGDDFSQAFENTVLAVVDQDQSLDYAW